VERDLRGADCYQRTAALCRRNDEDVGDPWSRGVTPSRHVNLTKPGKANPHSDDLRRRHGRRLRSRRPSRRACDC
jgi:hypothetical protein